MTTAEGGGGTKKNELLSRLLCNQATSSGGIVQHSTVSYNFVHHVYAFKSPQLAKTIIKIIQNPFWVH